VSNKAIVLDANILIRAVLGKRVREIILVNASTARFFAPDVAFADARTYLPALLKKRYLDSASGMKLLDGFERVIEILGLEVYGSFHRQALLRIGVRDPDDWPVLACAMAMGCPIWTEDTDFFGAGVATWTTDRVDLYFPEDE
jgi:predicted nucleic acid-binding protein